MAAAASPEELARHEQASAATQTHLRQQLYEACQNARTDIEQAPIRALQAQLDPVLRQLDLDRANGRHDPDLNRRARELAASIEDLRTNVTVATGDRLPYADLRAAAGAGRLEDLRATLERALPAAPTNQTVWSRFERHSPRDATAVVASVQARQSPERPLARAR